MLLLPKMKRSSLLTSVLCLLFVVSQALPLFFAFFVSTSTNTTTNNNVAFARQQLLNPALAKEHFKISLIPKQNATSVSSPSSVPPKQQPAPTITTTTATPGHYFKFNWTVPPPFKTIVKNHRNNEIVGDPQFLLDFAVIGHAKCGTSTMIWWLKQHAEIDCFGEEVPHLSLGKIGLFIKKLYHGLNHTVPYYQHGYKNPTDVQNLRALRLLRDYFPNTKLLVGIRHPVLWFQSFYNHRVQNTATNTNNSMPEPLKLVHGCFKGSQGVCGDRANYHLSLARLGKTNYTLEQDAFTAKEYKGLQKDAPKYMPNHVFLYDTQQLADGNETRALQFRKDIQQFLGLSHQPSLSSQMLHASPGKTGLNDTEQAARDAKKLRICDDEHKDVRKELMLISRRAAVWIQKYFLKAPQVFYSSPEYMHQILESYLHDPCDESSPPSSSSYQKVNK
jgi:hypothetical protein